MQALSTPYKIDREYTQEREAIDHLRREAYRMHLRNRGEVMFWVEILFPDGRIFGEIAGKCDEPGMTKSEVKSTLQERRHQLIRRAKGNLQFLMDSGWY